MRLTALVTTGTRIIEIEVEDGDLASGLVHDGFAYLGIVSTESRRRAILERHPQLTSRIIVSPSKRIVRQNNAELLILNGWTGANLARNRNFRHARHVAVKLRFSPACCAAILFGLWQWLLRRVSAPRIARLANSPAALVVFSLRGASHRSGARRYIPHALGVEGFLRELMKVSVRHAVLRWFEMLPVFDAGEDLDLLVDDACSASVSKILDSGPGLQPIDLYSATGLPGSDFRSIPYYPPYLAEQILDGAIDHRGLCKVPALREYFLSLAYHALYHKGVNSGLPEGCDKPRSASHADHDYRAILSAMAERLGIDAPITLRDLDRYLDSQGWRPPHDMLIRLARHNRWVGTLLELPAAAGASDEIAVFLLREVAMRRGGVDRACELLRGHGFQILAAENFAPQIATTIARSIRGGNWGQGPWPISGGPPVAAIVTRDPAPIAPARKERRRYPFLANARLLCKEQIRDAFNAGHASETHCNVVHSSDNGREALDYLRIIARGGSDRMVALLQQLETSRLDVVVGSSATEIEKLPRRTAA